MQHSSGLQLCIFVYRVVITRSGKILLWTYYKQILRRNISNMMIENVLDGKKTHNTTGLWWKFVIRKLTR